MANALTSVVHGEPSLRIACDRTVAHVTLRGAHVAPVSFRLGSREVSPYSLSPWLPGEQPGVEPLLDVLRGDFWCLPFGAQPDGPAHGDPASAAWSVVRHGPAAVTLALEAADSGGTFERTVSVRDGQAALFQEIVMEGLDGSFPFGTHPVLDWSGHRPGSVRISTSPLRWASTYPGTFSDPGRGERQVLAEGAVFDDLAAVPSRDGGTLDLSRYPTAPGHEDLVMLVHDPAAGDLGWSAASAPGFAWVALKDARILPSTLLWVSNGGRSQPPWSGRHLGRMGIEEVRSYFHAGLEPSREDRLADLGIPTALSFQPGVTVTVRVVHAVVATPAGFGRVARIETPDARTLRLVGEHGHVAEDRIDWGYPLGA